ncbi:thioredoxin domain-containing protein [Skeletonema marinoi]|uniref:Thioredoxin domain-containing protein n=1 Tax=Skeletonema marinoi TaxID=267567 RepID=A0AAD9DAU1_9STRA|nr:thioredoxin domain-containing protein [Skeletonema marinoi]
MKLVSTIAALFLLPSVSAFAPANPTSRQSTAVCSTRDGYKDQFKNRERDQANYVTAQNTPKNQFAYVATASEACELSYDPSAFPKNLPLQQIQGGNSRLTWKLPQGADRLQMLIQTNGRPLKARVELWLGPIRRVHFVDIACMNGAETPFRACLKFKNSDSAGPQTLEISTSEDSAFPALVGVDVMTKDRSVERQEAFDRIWKASTKMYSQGDKTVRVVPIADHVKSVQLLVWSKDVGKKSFKANVELLQGPNTKRQYYELQCGGGTQPYHAIFETPGNGGRCVGPTPRHYMMDLMNLLLFRMSWNPMLQQMPLMLHQCTVLDIQSPNLYESTHHLSKLFGSSTTNDDGVDAKKLTIETVTDDNMNTLLNPSSNLPVLVDAFAPWCGPCKLLDKVLRKAQPRYLDKVEFVRWNVNDKENTVELKKMFLESGNTLSKLPSLILFREGQPIAVRPGFANDFQLDFWLEESLPDVLEKTFDENGLKMVAMPKIEEDLTAVLPERKMLADSKIPKEEMLDEEESAVSSSSDEDRIECNDEEACLEFLEKMVWENRTVVPAFQGISWKVGI